MCVCVYTYIHTYTHSHTHIHAHIYTHLHALRNQSKELQSRAQPCACLAVVLHFKDTHTTYIPHTYAHIHTPAYAAKPE